MVGPSEKCSLSFNLIGGKALTDFTVRRCPGVPSILDGRAYKNRSWGYRKSDPLPTLTHVGSEKHSKTETFLNSPGLPRQLEAKSFLGMG